MAGSCHAAVLERLEQGWPPPQETHHTIYRTGRSGGRVRWWRMVEALALAGSTNDLAGQAHIGEGAARHGSDGRHALSLPASMRGS